MRELIKDNQLVTIVPQDFKKTNKGRVLEVSPEGIKIQAGWTDCKPYM